MWLLPFLSRFDLVRQESNSAAITWHTDATASSKRRLGDNADSDNALNRNNKPSSRSATSICSGLRFDESQHSSWRDILIKVILGFLPIKRQGFLLWVLLFKKYDSLDISDRFHWLTQCDLWPKVSGIVVGMLRNTYAEKWKYKIRCGRFCSLDERNWSQKIWQFWYYVNKYSLDASK